MACDNKLSAPEVEAEVCECEANLEHTAKPCLK